MKQRIILYVGLMMASIMFLGGCKSPKGLVFADREWHISDFYGQIIDRDTTYRMTFGNVLIPRDMCIISSADSLVMYPGLERFMADVLHTVRLDSAEILFYAPQMKTMFVKPKQPYEARRPSSISVNPAEEKPFTMWINEDDAEDWVRTPSEMYTYTFFNRRKRQILIVDFYDYGDVPIAQIFVFQSRRKDLDKIGLTQAIHWPFFFHDLRKYERDVEFWSYCINGHRRLASANYTIGQEQKQRNK